MPDPLAWLFGLEQFGIKLGLENIRALAASLGHPERACPTLHIAGTNGKGSVTAMVDAVLRSAGHRSARYTSPHLVNLSERFVVDGRAATTQRVEAVVRLVHDRVEELRASGRLLVQPTFFEATTAVAFELFRQAHAGVVVVEVGLGGRLDATNVVEPLATAITSVDFDHQPHLGQTLRDIAIEKAGIIKPGVPVVVGDMPTEAADAVAGVAVQRGAELTRATDGVDAQVIRDSPGGQIVRVRTPAHDYGEFELRLRGAHQLGNAMVAIRLAEICDRHGLAVPASAVTSGLAAVDWPGRLDVRHLADGRIVVLDAAHNPAGAVVLASYLQRQGGARNPLVFAAMRDKDIRGILRVLLPVVSRLVVTRPSTPRAADPESIAELARSLAPEVRVAIAASPAAALADAWRDAGQITVAGSIFLLGDVLKAIKGT